MRLTSNNECLFEGVNSKIPFQNTFSVLDSITQYKVKGVTEEPTFDVDDEPARIARDIYE